MDNKIEKINVPWLEIPVTEHCNLKCKGCTHHSPYLKPCFYDYEQYVKDINILKDIYHVKILIFLGGEPLLNKGISEYIAFAREAKIADIYRITTNGLLLMKMNDDFFKVIDEIKVSLYPNIGIDKNKLETFLKEKSNIYKFNYSIREFEDFIDIETDRLSDEDAQINFNKCDRRRNGHLVYNGYYYKCMRPVSTKQFLEHNNPNVDVPDFRIEDGILLNGENLKFRLQQYIKCDGNLLSCHYCLLGFNEKGLLDKLKSIVVNNDVLTKFIYNSRGLYSLYKYIEKKSNNRKDRIAHKTKKVVNLFKHQQLSKGEYDDISS
ncbi:radical SAM protein [Clostridium sp. C8-1-8]|uniref:radical SAM protein n=1 Tax=Clostridium sp. C8-1-8 TaxID=2698831 RepID=UPI0013697F87|nr:radical SAM protein [Clostridium sp. C8-1-8]